LTSEQVVCRAALCEAIQKRADWINFSANKLTCDTSRRDIMKIYQDVIGTSSRMYLLFTDLIEELGNGI